MGLQKNYFFFAGALAGALTVAAGAAFASAAVVAVAAGAASAFLSEEEQAWKAIAATIRAERISLFILISFNRFTREGVGNLCDVDSV